MRTTKYTNDELFQMIVGILEKKELLPESLDYVHTYTSKKMAFSDYEFDVIGIMQYGSCEGIYLTMYATGVMDETEDNKRIELGSFKTLGRDRESMYVMAKLQADFIVEATEFVDKNIVQQPTTKVMGLWSNASQSG